MLKWNIKTESLVFFLQNSKKYSRKKFCSILQGFVIKVWTTKNAQFRNCIYCLTRACRKTIAEAQIAYQNTLDTEILIRLRIRTSYFYLSKNNLIRPKLMSISMQLTQQEQQAITADVETKD